ncbi:MAG: AEC family transporter [Fimbriimonadaceae bacterium]
MNLADLVRQFAFLFADVVLPILVLALTGYLLQRRFSLHMETLAKVQVNLLVPAFMVSRVGASTLSWSEIGLILAAVLLGTFLLAVPVWTVVRSRGLAMGTSSVLVLAAVVFNSGNFGIPLAERAYGTVGGEVQALVLLASSLAMFGLGYILMASKSGVGQGLAAFLKTPIFWSMVAGLGLKLWGRDLPVAVGYPIDTLASGLVPLALVTLGAQMAMRVGPPQWRFVAPVLGLKLLGLPVAMALVVWLFGLWPWPGAMLIVAAAAPSAVNTIILSIELDGDTEVAAECIVWTTLASTVSVTLILAVVKGLGGLPPG